MMDRLSDDLMTHTTPLPPRPRAPRSEALRPGRSGVAVAVLAALSVLAASVAPSAAQTDGAGPAAPADPSAAVVVFDLEESPGDPFPLAPGDALAGARELLPESVRDVPVTSALVSATEAELQALETTILDNRRARDTAMADLARLQDERRTLRLRYTNLRDRRRAASIEAEELRGELARIAVAAYVGAGNPDLVLELDASVATEAGRQRALVDAVDSTLRDRLADAEAEAANAATQAEAVRADLDTVAAHIDDATHRRDAALATLAAAEPELPRLQQRYHDQFLLAPVRGADFEVVALDAYRTAAERMAAENPQCRLPWTVLAGIARVESRHGTYGGARLRADGTTNRRILGVALDGSPGIMHIPDTDGGTLDGDATFDRAVGPMQFIPSTWRMVRRDGNGDGRMDPHNLYDAAYAAGVYLCRNGDRLDQLVGQTRAILTYNRSQVYVDTVLGHHRAYQRLSLG
jgi:membrane-bound lytic murein transglycosylase B